MSTDAYLEVYPVGSRMRKVNIGRYGYFDEIWDVLVEARKLLSVLEILPKYTHEGRPDIEERACDARASAIRWLAASMLRWGPTVKARLTSEHFATERPYCDVERVRRWQRERSEKRRIIKESEDASGYAKVKSELAEKFAHQYE